MKKIVATLIVAAATLAVVVSAQQVRDQSAAPKPASAGISGIVTTDEQTPQPLRRAAVTVVGGEGLVRTTYTNDAGRFSIAGLPAGRYQLAAQKAPYLRMSYGAKRPEGTGSSITLANGAQMTDVALRLPKGSVIAGRIVDENGEPAFGVGVRVMQARMVNGERTLQAPSIGSANDMTDDRGMFRLFGLAPGDYIVIATPRSTPGEIRAMTETEIRAVMAALQQQQAAKAAAAQQQSQPVVGYGAPTPTPTPTPSPTPDVDKVTIAYAPVYYPGNTRAASASLVTVGAGEERGGLDFPLQLVRTAKVEGQVIVPEGIAPQSVQIMMMPAGQGVGSGQLAMAALEQMLQQRVAPGPDGKFSYNSIAPGTYVITARATRGTGPVPPLPPPPPPGVARGGGGNAVTFSRTIAVGAGGADIVEMIDGVRLGGGDPNAIQYWAQVEIPVDGMPVSGITLALQPGMTITGRLEFKSLNTRPGAELKSVSLNLSPVQGPGGGGLRLQIGGPGVKIDENGEFTINGVVPGRYRITANAPGASSGPFAGQPWRLGSAIVKGRDVLDFPFDVGPGEDISGAVVTLTDAQQEISGTLQDASGRPTTDYTVVVFPADRALWGATRRIRTARPATDGKFTLPNLPAGDYMMAAVTDLLPNEQNDQAFLESIVKAAFKITLVPGEKKVQDLRISGGL